MLTIPEIVPYDLEIKFIKVGFLGYYSNSENVNVHWYDLKEGKLITHFSREFNSSVWIHDREKYERFAQTFTVLAGGWYGTEYGGRWNTFKKTDGEITFDGVINFKQCNCIKSLETIFTVIKRPFTNMIRIKVNNETTVLLTFKCKNITFNSSNKIYLYHREKNKYINATDILEPGGLGIEKFI